MRWTVWRLSECCLQNSSPLKVIRKLSENRKMRTVSRQTTFVCLFSVKFHQHVAFASCLFSSRCNINLTIPNLSLPRNLENEILPALPEHKKTESENYPPRRETNDPKMFRTHCATISPLQIVQMLFAYFKSKKSSGRISTLVFIKFFSASLGISQMTKLNTEW